MTFRVRVQATMLSLLLSLAFLIGSLRVYTTTKLLASEAPVAATVASVSGRWSRDGQYYYFGRLQFDRQQSADGKIIHCDVPQVPVGIKQPEVGSTIMVAPQENECSEPYLLPVRV